MSGQVRAVAAVEDLRAEIVCRVQHEFRTPVTIAAMAFEELRSGPVDAEREERCKEMLGRALARLQAHVRQLDALSQAGEDLTLADTDLVAVLRTASAELEPFCAARGIRMILVVSGATRSLRLNGGLIGSALKGILDNAARFNRPGGEVRVSVSFAEDRVVIQVEDDGIGIPAEQLELVLSGFLQAEPVLTRSEGGLGIGFAAARRIVERHGGRIEVWSRAGRGTTVAVTLTEARHEP